MIKNKFIVPVVSVIFVLIVLLSVLVQKDAQNNFLSKNKENSFSANSISGFAVHPLYPLFSSANSGFSFNNVSGLVSVADTVVYKYGYYSINGSVWQNFTLAGSAYNGAASWLAGSTSSTLSAFGLGEHYIIIYSCTYNLSNSTWDCHDNRWQLIVINNTPAPNCSDGIKNQNEVFTDCGGVCPACECLTSQTQSCIITNGVGSQTRNCTDGIYSSWGLCIVVSCNSGYIISGNSCVLNSSSGTWSNELMVNGGFETGTLAGWTSGVGTWTVGYDSIDNGLAGPQAGSYCVYNDVNAAVGNYIYQDVNLTSYASSIDGGTAVINVSGWGVSTNYNSIPAWDVTRIQFIFLNSAKGVISTPRDTGYVNNQSWWQTKLSEYAVPVNTRYIRVWGNSYENGYTYSGSLDSFSAKIRTGPCTDTCASLGYDCGSVCGVICGSYSGGCQSGYYCSSGHCIACTTHATSSCYNGDVYWYNSCGTIEGIRYDCNSTQTCSNGLCVDILATSTIIIDHTSTNVSKIPLSCINKVKTDLHIAYSHTSHGSQIYTGMQALQAQNPIYGSNFYVVSGQLHFEDYYGYGDQSGFATGGCYDLSDCDNGGDGLLGPTREFLDGPNGQDINVILWSWCSIAEHSMPFYLSTMQTAITEYPDVQFVFITGHAEGGGEGDSSDSQNNIIRDFVNNNAFCDTHRCILFDFADMENYDPDNNYFLDRYVTDALNYDGGNWGVDYLTRHPTGLNADLTNLVDYACAHSETPYEANINCALKGQAAWWMFARMVGWDGDPSHGC